MKWQYSHMFLQRSIDGSKTKEQGTLVQLHQEYVEKILGHHNHPGISRYVRSLQTLWHGTGVMWAYHPLRSYWVSWS